MPRPPNPESATLRLVLEGKPGEAAKIRAVKELCARNNITVRQVLMAGVDKFLKDHNWPPGNSQTLLEQFGSHLKLVCLRCSGLFPHLTRVEFISGLTGAVCDNCLAECKEKTTVKCILGRI